MDPHLVESSQLLGVLLEVLLCQLHPAFLQAGIPSSVPSR